MIVQIDYWPGALLQ